MGKKVVAILSIVAILFTMIPAARLKTVQAATDGSITIYNLKTDSGLAGGTMASTALAKAGNPTVDVVTGSALHLTNVVNSWDSMDLLSKELKSEGSYLTGKYTFTVTGHVDPGVATAYVGNDGKAAALQMVLGQSGGDYAQYASKVIAPDGDGTFTLTYTHDYTSAELGNLGYNFRIQKNGEGSKDHPTSFYIDDITVSVVPSANQGPEPEVPDITLPEGTTNTVYDLSKDVKLTSGAALEASPAFKNCGSSTASVVQGEDASISIYVQGRKDNWDGVDIIRTAFKQSNGYYAGNYTFTVKGHINQVDVASSSAFYLGMTESPWGQLSKATSPATDGTFTLTYTKYYSTKAIDTLAYNFRIQTSGKTPASFYIDSIIVTVTGAKPPVEIIPKWDLTLASMVDAYKSFFLMGNIMEPGQTTDAQLTAMYKKQYNVLTAENCMKPESLSSAKGVYNYTEADKLMNWAQVNGIKVHAHTLVWYSQSPDWLMKNSDGTPLTRAEAKANMESYIKNVAGHFAGKVISWDVVNEAFANDVVTAPKDWKAVLRGAAGISDQSRWYAAYANGADASKGESGADFIYDAFVFTRLADPAAKLFYNDYNETEVGKREAIALMAEDLNAKWKSDSRNTNPSRPLIEGIGMQAHYWTGELNPQDVEDSIKRFIKAGVDISVSELDIPVGTYPTYKDNTELTAANEAKQAELYKQLFKIYIKYEKNIDRVTVWGKADPQSWRWEGYPTLFDNAFAPKDAYYKVMEAVAEMTAPVLPGVDNNQNSTGTNNNPVNNPADKPATDKPDTSKDETVIAKAETKSLNELAKDNKVVAKLLKDKELQGVFASVTESLSAPTKLVVNVEGAKPEQKVYVYHVNEKTGKLETVAFSYSYKVDEKGNATFPILDDGNYVVLTKKANSHLVTPMRNQILLFRNLATKVGKTIVLKPTLPASLELTDKLTDKTKAEGIGAATVSYVVSDPSIATVDANGNIVALKAGEITITTTVKLYNGTEKTFESVLKIKK